MTRKNMEHIIVKYINNEASIAEMNDLLIWLENKDNLKIFKDYLRINHQLNNEEVFDALQAFQIASKKTAPVVKTKQLIKFQLFKYSVAASILLLVALTIFFSKNKEVKITPVEPTIVNNSITTGTDKAILTLNDGTDILLKNGVNYRSSNVIGSSKEIVYTPPQNKKEEIKYNYLTIPRGGQFLVKLTDGTQVWLNSESQLKFPVNFIDGENRIVELVYGEAYFDVSPSTDHKGSSFKVLNGPQEIEVLGTEFNIKAYRDETNIYTTLVEGSVALNFENKHTILKPGEQSNIDVTTNTLNMSTVNIYDQISWKKGVFSFKRKTLKEIMQVLSRWYNMDVNFDNKELASKGFSGVLGKEQSIEEILETFKNLEIIKNYEINNKKIILK